jgi:hypothetical protein
MNKIKQEVGNKILTEMRKGEGNPYEYASDTFMKELTLGIFENLYEEAGLEKKGKCERSFRIEQLYEIINFCNSHNDYWWRCLQEFAPTIDRRKLKNKIIKKAEETIIKIKKDLNKEKKSGKIVIDH